MTFGEKIKDARKHKKLTQKQLADIIGAAHNSISDWENDKNKPDPDTIELICGILEIAPNYLLGHDNDAFSPFDKSLIHKFHSLDEMGKETVSYILDREIQRTQSLKALSDQADQLRAELSQQRTITRYFSYYGRVAAAGTSFGFEDIVENATIMELPLTDLNRSADYLIGVSGDSMEPAYSDGDIVYVKKTDHLEIGQVGIFQKDNGIYIKEVGENGLISCNEKYKPMIDGGNVICLGKVIGKVEE